MAEDPSELLGWYSNPLGLQPPDREISRESLHEWYDNLFRANGGGGYTTALTSQLRSIQIMGPGQQLMPIADDTIGLAYVSRPMLNLSDKNCMLHPQLYALYRPDRGSLMAYVKGMLDPVWGAANAGDDTILDPLNPWLVPCSRFLKVSSGFPDLSLGTGNSSPGIRKETYRFVNGLLEVNHDFDIQQSYYNPSPGFLPYMFEAWVHYIDGVTTGDHSIEPRFQALRQNYLDYTCRIYHIIMNRNMRNIEWIFCCGGGMPTTFPSGSFSTIDRTQNTLRGQGQDELSINFAVNGFRFNNVMVADAFNRTTLRVNPNMHPKVRNAHYRKLSFQEPADTNYPWINVQTMEMEYWSRK